MNDTAVFSVIVGALSLFVIVLGWFVSKIWDDHKQKDERVYGQIEKLELSTAKLSDSISGLNAILLTQQEKVDASFRVHEAKHDQILDRFSYNEKRIDNNEKKIKDHDIFLNEYYKHQNKERYP